MVLCTLFNIATTFLRNSSSLISIRLFVCDVAVVVVSTRLGTDTVVDGSIDNWDGRGEGIVDDDDEVIVEREEVEDGGMKWKECGYEVVMGNRWDGDTVVVGVRVASLRGVVMISIGGGEDTFFTCKGHYQKSIHNIFHSENVDVGSSRLLYRTDGFPWNDFFFPRILSPG